MNSGTNAEETLRLQRRFKAAHTSLSYPRQLMRQFGTVIGILRRVVNCFRDQFSMRNAMTFQLVRHYLPRFAMIISKQPLEEPLSSCAVPSRLQKHIDHLSVLINGSPQIFLLAADLHEDFINEKCIAETLLPTLQPLGISRPKLVTPDTISFITDSDSDISMTQVKSIIEPNRVLINSAENRWRFYCVFGVFITLLSRSGT